MTEPVSRGDRYDIPFTVNGDLTGAVTRLLAKSVDADDADDAIELDHTVTDEAAGEGNLTDTSGLAVDSYLLELEATNGTQIITYRMSDRLKIVQDLG